MTEADQLRIEIACLRRDIAQLRTELIEARCSAATWRRSTQILMGVTPEDQADIRDATDDYHRSLTREG